MAFRRVKKVSISERKAVHKNQLQAKLDAIESKLEEDEKIIVTRYVVKTNHAMAESGKMMKSTRHKSQGKPIATAKKYVPSMPNMQALPIIDGVKILPKMKRKPNLAKVDSDYQKPRFQSVKRKVFSDDRLYSICQKMPSTGKQFIFGR